MKPAPTLTPGLVSITFRACSPEEIIALAARAGLAAIEWGADVHVPPDNIARARHLARATQDAGLAVSSYGSYYRAGQEPQAFDDLLRTAVALGAPRLRVWAGTQDAHAADAATRRAITGDLRRIARLAATEGVRIALEFHGGTLTSDAASAAALLRDLAGEAVDSYWQPRVGASPPAVLEDLRALAPWVQHVHVFQWGPAGERHPLADGAAVWTPRLDALAALGRPVQVQLEYVKDDRPGQLLEDAAILLGWLAGRQPG